MRIHWQRVAVQARALHPRNHRITLPCIPAQAQELWLGPSHHGSVFSSRAALRRAWLEHGDHIMAVHRQAGKRPQAWWEFESGNLQFNADRERSTLWRAGVLAESEVAELEAYWRQEFERTFEPSFGFHSGGRVLRDGLARREHYKWADIPRELVKAWTSQRRARTIRRRKQTATSPAEPAEAPGGHLPPPVA